MQKIDSNKEALDLGVYENWEEIWDQYASDPRSMLGLIELYKYKNKKWKKRFKDSVGVDPVVDERQVDRKARVAERKRAIMNGWWLDDEQSVGSCAYCGIPLGLHEMTEDHVIPKSDKGGNEITNLIPCCLDCNDEKSSDSIEEYLSKIQVPPDKIVAVIANWTSPERAVVPTFISYRLSCHQQSELGIGRQSNGEEAES